MEKRIGATLKETVASRRLVAKGAAAGGLATLFAAVATGRVLADDSPDTSPDVGDSPDTSPDDSPDTSPDLDDSPDTTPSRPDEADTTPDDGETTNDNAVKGFSKRRKKNGRG